jgi:hypothetical protein
MATRGEQANVEAIIAASGPPVKDIGKRLQVQDPNEWVAGTLADYKRVGMKLTIENVTAVCASQMLSDDETEQWLKAVGIGARE